MAILLGRLLTDALMIVISSALVVLVAVLMGVTIATGIPGIILLLVTAAFFGLTWSGIFLAIGMRTRSAETLSSFGSGVAFILLFVSSGMFPTSIMPSWAQTVSNWNPVSYVSNALRSTIIGGYDWRAFASAYIMTTVLAVIAFAAALYQFRKTTS